MRCQPIIASLVLLFSAAVASAHEQVTVMLDWVINADHAPLFVAEQIGAYAEQGIAVNLVQPSDPNAPPRLVADHKADFAISYQPQLYLLADQGLPVVRVGTVVNSPLNTLTTLKSSGIRAIADLRGKRIGYSVSGTDTVTLNTMLHHAGLTVRDVHLVRVNFDLVDALVSGKVDAIIGGYRNIEAPELRAKGVVPVLFPVEDYGIPPYDELIVLAHRDRLKQPVVRRFLQALQKGTAYLAAHPEETWTTFAKQHPEYNQPVFHASWLNSVRYFAKNPFQLDIERYRAYGHFLFTQQIIRRELPVDDYAVSIH